MIKVLVKAGCKESRVEFSNDKYIVYVKARAEKGEANKELVKVMSKHLGKKVRIVSGFGSRVKYLEVS